ncbi:hypothetical protein KVA01_02960 [Kocuria varians]|uniref:Uncharacterized protein n=1 Tax=Kocuria varians TaxID=1272 RepID=A0A4Y4CZ38_KOCVA|nr:hypothetical protein KVA01_02960 [Kocuria varians]
MTTAPSGLRARASEVRGNGMGAHFDRVTARDHTATIGREAWRKACTVRRFRRPKRADRR